MLQAEDWGILKRQPAKPAPRPKRPRKTENLTPGQWLTPPPWRTAPRLPFVIAANFVV